ncbi:hypothetical protein GGR58DRAFT_506165 [Xylaria digitata]|nr:hypothetical protein GGR58DRAFT_506165 [Xylaria digitata]
MDLRILSFWSLFLFGYRFPGIAYRRTERAQIARATGIGLSAPPATRHAFRDLIRYEWHIFLAFLGLLAAGAYGLHSLLQPQHIYSTKYVLAVLYMVYIVAALALLYQAIREIFWWHSDPPPRNLPNPDPGYLNRIFRGDLASLDLALPAPPNVPEPGVGESAYLDPANAPDIYRPIEEQEADEARILDL